MQNVSKAYKDSMNGMLRNRGYIKVYIGVINSEAQKNITVENGQNEFTFYSDEKKPFDGYTVENVYATAEQDFSKVDGSMYFLPSKNSDLPLFNNGIVTNDLLGSIYISFQGVVGLDIKGLTIDWGETYPVDFTIQNDAITRSYSGNTKRNWVTEDVFDGTSYLIITPTKMVNENARLRIYQFSCGIVNTFTNVETKKYSSKEYVSSISETIPSTDVSITVDNQNGYYSPDNPESALGYMEVGQEVKVVFGYDTNDDGNIEWLPETTSYLKSWSASDTEAKFTATDRFDYLSDKYYKGLFRASGISLYDLAIDVLTDAGITDEREYFVDPYLKDVIVYNPIPPVKHSEALQIIANAGRCALYEDRQSRIHLQSSFIPDMVASANNETNYSHIENVLADDNKDAYAITSNDFSVADGSVFFMTSDTNYINTGYISESIADGNGDFAEQPKITIDLESAFVAFGVLVRFRNVAPQEFHIITYYQDVQVQDITVNNHDLEYITNEQLDLFDRMEILVTKGYPNARVTIDNVIIGDVTDYNLSRTSGLTVSPVAVRQDKIRQISVERKIYNLSVEDAKELQTEEIVLSPDNNEYTVYFSNPSYELSASVIDNASISVEIIDSSSYFARLRFNGLPTETVVKYSLMGKEYVVDINYLSVQHNQNGILKEWKNPLVSTIQHAKDLEEWLASFFLGDVDYQITWRGDPRTDANDLYYLELKNLGKTLIRTYQNELSFNGAWSGKMKSRKVVL